MSENSVDNVNVASQELLITPNQLKEEIPLTDKARAVVVQGRDDVRNILDRKDHRVHRAFDIREGTGRSRHVLGLAAQFDRQFRNEPQRAL